MVNTKVKLCGIEMDNPIIPASGTYGFGYEFAELYDINILGSLSFKGTTREARFGNPTPRIAECPSGMLNAVGLQNPGVDKVISEELPKLRTCFSKPVMANVSGFSEEEPYGSPSKTKAHKLPFSAGQAPLRLFSRLPPSLHTLKLPPILQAGGFFYNGCFYYIDERL